MILINKTIEALMEQKRISVRQMAEEIGMSSTGLYKALDKNDFKISLLQKIAEILEVDICDFFPRSDKNDFEKDLKYFIYSSNPGYYDKVGNYIGDEFIMHSLKGIYLDYIFKNSTEFLNKKYKRNIRVTDIYLDYFPDSKGLSVGYSDGKEFGAVDVPEKPYLITVIKELYKSIDSDDEKFINSQTNNANDSFPSFIKNSAFLDWYKRTFNITDESILSILMKVSSTTPIVLGRPKREVKRK